MMKNKSLITYLTALIVAFGALVYSSTQTINTLPSADSNFLSRTTGFMSNELPQYMQLQGMAPFVYSGGTAATSADLTHTIAGVTGFPNHYFVTQAATAHTYTATTRTFVYLMDDDARTLTIAGAVITYSTRLAFAEMAAASAQPATPNGCIPLARVDTNAASITAVADLRPSQVYFVYRDADGTLGGASAFVTSRGVTVFQVNGDGSVSMYATTYSNMPSGTTVLGTAGEILVIPHGGDALNTVSGMPRISGNSLFGVVPQANLPDPYQAGVSAINQSITGGVFVINLNKSETLTGNSLWGSRIGNWGATAGVTATISSTALPGMNMLFILTQGVKGGNTIAIVPYTTDTIIGVSSTFSSGNSTMLLAGGGTVQNGGTVQYFANFECFVTGYWHLTGVSGLDYRNRIS